MCFLLFAEQNREIAGRAGAVEAVSDAMRRHISHAGVTLEATKALLSLLHLNGESCRAIIDLDRS